MAAAVFTLPAPKVDPKAAPVELWFLTGGKFWYQTAFCAWTFSHCSQRRITLQLVDDGTLSSSNESELRRLFPAGSTVRKSDITRTLAQQLPPKRFPVLHQRWDDYINIRKLTDIHLATKGRKLVLDSDMLFFARPDALLDWIDSDNPLPLLMTDYEENYGYSRPLLRELCGEEPPRQLNVGLCGLRSEDLDWPELEHWCRELFAREGTSYYLEQALVAMLAARKGAEVLPATDYITYPTRSQTLNRVGVMQHYVADSKPWYFQTAWRLAIT